MATVHFHRRIAVARSHDAIGGMFLPAGDLGSVVTAAHQTFHRENGTFGIGYGLALGGIAHQSFLIGECHNGGSGAPAVGIGNALGILAFHHIDTAIGGAKVDAYNLAHM